MKWSREAEFYSELMDTIQAERMRKRRGRYVKPDAEGAPLQVPPESRRLDRAMIKQDEHTR